ncbi:hypothetical protein [Methanobacterium sp. BAmetb5]|uniref:hypothetical protein n=1 Tax=Methanobacterium sp. BAmetb5 TaxID=2025351 RepID=UPI0025EBB44B|nr:hypothetical protein [Methanobacterium sp. BAmetb5]
MVVLALVIKVGWWEVIILFSPDWIMVFLGKGREYVEVKRIKAVVTRSKGLFLLMGKVDE